MICVLTSKNSTNYTLIKDTASEGPVRAEVKSSVLLNTSKSNIFHFKLMEEFDNYNFNKIFMKVIYVSQFN